MTLPDVEGEITLANPSTGNQVIVNPKIAKVSYEKYALEQANLVEDIFKKSEADYLDLVTNKGFSVPLAMFLKERIQKKI